MFFESLPSLLDLALNRHRERCETFSNWFPFPALISFGLVAIFNLFLLPSLNPRLGNPANIMSLKGISESEGTIWFAVRVVGQDVVVTTGDRKIFKWPAKLVDEEPLAAFKKFLKARADNEIMKATLAKQAGVNQVSAVIAADQRLKYLHIRPILNALAAARITNYAFETRNTTEADLHTSASF